jgi:hypothetical protein
MHTQRGERHVDYVCRVLGSHRDEYVCHNKIINQQYEADSQWSKNESKVEILAAVVVEDVD